MANDTRTAEEAWDEGYNAGMRAHRLYLIGDDKGFDDASLNPYHEYTTGEAANLQLLSVADSFAKAARERAARDDIEPMEVRYYSPANPTRE